MEQKYTDSMLYLSVLQYIKENGIRDLLNFIEALEKFKRYSFVSKEYSELELFHFLKSQSNKEFLSFLQQFSGKENELNLISMFYSNSMFKKFLFALDERVVNLDLYIENAKKLNELGVDIVTLRSPRFIEFRVKRSLNGSLEGIPEGHYSDENPHIFERTTLYGKEYSVIYDGSTWVLVASGAESKFPTMYMYMDDFDVDLTKLPSKEELKNEKLVRILK